MAELRAPGPPERGVRVALLETMIRIRLFEEALFRALMAGRMPGTIHQAIGQEAVAAGVGAALGDGDLMTSTHRGHGHAIAKGLPLRELAAEMHGKSTGSSGGMGGSMHIFDLGRGFLGTTGIVGGGVPIAVGAGLASHLEGDGRVVAAFFGDGAVNQGAVHEAMNLASIWRLPVLFVCENNQYAVSMPVADATKIEHLAGRAAAYGFSGQTVDGNDVEAVYAAAVEATDRQRAGGGPHLLECLTYRHKGHSRFEPARYRPEGELERWKAADPIARQRDRLLSGGILSAAEADSMTDAVREAVEEAFALARADPDIDPSVVSSLVYAHD